MNEIWRLAALPISYAYIKFKWQLVWWELNVLILAVIPEGKTQGIDLGPMDCQ